MAYVCCVLSACSRGLLHGVIGALRGVGGFEAPRGVLHGVIGRSLIERIGDGFVAVLRGVGVFAAALRGLRFEPRDEIREGVARPAAMAAVGVILLPIGRGAVPVAASFMQSAGGVDALFGGVADAWVVGLGVASLLARSVLARARSLGCGDERRAAVECPLLHGRCGRRPPERSRLSARSRV